MRDTYRYVTSVLCTRYYVNPSQYSTFGLSQIVLRYATIVERLAIEPNLTTLEDKTVTGTQIMMEVEMPSGEVVRQWKETNEQGQVGYRLVVSVGMKVTYVGRIDTNKLHADRVFLQRTNKRGAVQRF